MGIFSRFMNFIRIRTNSALDKAEDPGQVMDYSYSKQLEQLQQLRRSIADVVTNEKRLEMQQKDVEAKAKQMAETAFQERPLMDEVSLRHYLITEEARSGIPLNGSTTYQAMYMKTYKALQQQNKSQSPILLPEEE